MGATCCNSTSIAKEEEIIGQKSLEHGASNQLLIEKRHSSVVVQQPNISDNNKYEKESSLQENLLCNPSVPQSNIPILQIRSNSKIKSGSIISQKVNITKIDISEQPNISLAEHKGKEQSYTEYANSSPLTLKKEFLGELIKEAQNINVSEEKKDSVEEKEDILKVKMIVSKNGKMNVPNNSNVSVIPKNRSNLSSDNPEKKKITISQQVMDDVSSNGKKQSIDISKSVKSIKIGKELFVNLKKGSISKFYITGQVLGQGAFGKVWKVTHKTTGLVRAMKQLKKSALIKEEEERLFSEMNILRNLDHPHVVKLFELFQDDQNYYLITEFLSGGELFDRIKKWTYFSEKRAADLMRQILLAVVYCHEQKIVHRDLKPENIIFATDQQDSNIKVIDFGTSRKFTGKVMTKKLGTPYYIAPEVLNQNYNEKCDVWSCGVILFILLCGYPPFTGKTEKEILAKVQAGKFMFDPDDWNQISTDVKHLIQKMLTLDVNQRLTAKQALSDPWIQKHAPSQQINKKALANLQSFQAQSIFKQALLQYMVSQMSTQQEIDELQKTFQSLDKNNDGFLSKDELIEGYILVLRDKIKAEEEVNRILELIDLNQSGRVDFSEFLMAAMNKEKLISLKKMEQAFRIFDQDGDGYISKQEVRLVMGDVNDDLWDQFLLEVDSNNDGRISLEEFKKVLTTSKRQ